MRQPAARPRVVLYVHLHEDAVRKDYGVARIVDIGPILSCEIREWLDHTYVTIKPVIDLADQVAFDAYEHPESLKERVRLHPRPIPFPTPPAPAAGSTTTTSRRSSPTATGRPVTTTPSP